MKKELKILTPEQEELLFSNLTEKERIIFYKRFIQGRTLSSIGNDYGVTRERIRQISSKALGRFRINLKNLIDEAKSAEILREKNKKLSIYINNLAQSEISKVEFDYTDIDALDLTVRGYNSLRRAGINTIADLEKNLHNIEKIRNLGKKTEKDILAKYSAFKEKQK